MFVKESSLCLRPPYSICRLQNNRHSARQSDSRYPRTNVRGTLSEVICLSSGIHPRVDTRGPLRTVDSRQTFSERLPTVAPLYARTTARLAERQAETWGV